LCVPDLQPRKGNVLQLLRSMVLRRRARKKFVDLLNSRKVDVIHIQFPVPKFNCLIPSDLPVIVTYHGSDLLQQYGPSGNLIYKLNSRASYVTTVSGGLLAELLNAHPGLSSKSTRIRNGRPSKEVHDNHEKSGQSPRYILFAADLIHRKAVELLVRAFARLPQTTEHLLYIAGDGVGRDALYDLVNKLGIGSRVKYLGALDRTDAIMAMKDADVMVLPSRREGLPLAILEAMSVGCPVVASAISGNAELISQGENGYLFEPENVDDLAEKLWRIVSDPDNRRNLSAGSLNTAKRYPTWEEVYGMYRELYIKVMKSTFHECSKP